MLILILMIILLAYIYLYEDLIIKINNIPDSAYQIYIKNKNKYSAYPTEGYYFKKM